MKSGQAAVQLSSEVLLKKLVRAIQFTYEYTYGHSGLPTGWPATKPIRRPSRFELNKPMKTWMIDLDLRQHPTLDPRVLSAVVGGFYNALPEAEQGDYEVQHGQPLKKATR